MSAAGHIASNAGFVASHAVATGGVEFDVIIEYVAEPALLPAAAIALQERIERAREAAERVLQSGHVPLPADVEDAIAEVLEARRRLRALQPGGTAAQAGVLRGELFTAIDALGTLFDEEKPE